MTDDVHVSGYNIIRKLGEGGMATVYLAVQESLDREVALKVMSPVLAANETFCEQFMKEGRIAAKLTHPHLMTVHDIGAEDSVYYLASEYLPAGTLRERMDRITTAEVLDVARDIASGLQFAHEKGFVHRDVKPGNIMFRANGTAVLADFGIAKAMKSVSAATMAGNAIGTPDYMSPEQAQASMIDGRSDLYSLGAVIYECLAGHKPYQANDAYAVALMHVTEPVPNLPEKVAWLQPLIDGLMAKNPEGRFATGDAFIAALDRMLHEHPLPGSAGPEKRSTRKRAALPGFAPARGSTVQSAEPASGRRSLVMGGGAAAVIVVGWAILRRAPTPEPVPPAISSPPPPSFGVPQPEPDQASAALAKLDVPTLLSRAQEYLGHGLQNGGDKLSFPAGDNAIDLFHEALKREPGNQQAAQGLAQIASFYESGARFALQQGLYTGTDELIEKGLRADPNSAGLQKLRTELAKAQKGG
jgi:serine/threonine-protein kinase PpkA